MNRKESKGKRLLSTALIAIIVLSVFTAGIGILPVGVSAQEASVTRYLPHSVEPTETLVVELTQSGFIWDTGGVWEVLPEGFEYVDGSYTGAAPDKVTYNTTTRTLKVPFRREYSIEYSVNASSYPQTAEFSGTWKTFDSQWNTTNGTVVGDTEVTVLKDEIPPASITNLQSTNGSTWISWMWTNPGDVDFSHVTVYLNGTWRANTTNEFYYARGLDPDTEYEIGARTVDNAGNINATWVNGTARTTRIFDTGSGTYPSISGTHSGTIKPNVTIKVSTLYTYPCAGTGGHTEYARIWNTYSGLNATATWNGYGGGWHKIVFYPSFTLIANETYNYTIRTGSYPQVHHTRELPTANGWINCTSFTDANGRVHYDWIPAIRLYI